MLENSFVHLPGIGPETEQKLWSQGLRTWDDLQSNLTALFSAKKANQISAALEQSRSAHECSEFEFFQGRFKGSEMWRLFPDLLRQGLDKKVAYLDIETTGLGFPPASYSTTIAVLFDGVLHLEHELDRKYTLLKEINSQAKMIVTFNGGPFDLPFLRKEFGLLFQQAHLDLRFWFAKLERRGGLKKIQQSFPHVHQRNSMDIDGFDAVRLWGLHKKGTPRALDTLLTYNAEDTIILEQLLYTGLNMEAERRTHLGLPTYTLPEPPLIPTEVCPEVYRLLRGHSFEF
jgi:uncharacterized protein YprB with RNaseH-like and TPR domain